MKLSKHLSNTEEKLSEFDEWLTPTLDDIRKSVDVKNAIIQLTKGFNLLSEYTEEFTKKGNPSQSISVSFINSTHEGSSFAEDFQAMTNALLLSTGKTDNNLKCQFPLFLYKKYGYKEFPTITKKKIKMEPTPRSLDLDKIMFRFEKLKSFSAELQPYFKAYIDTILSDEQYEKQFYALGKSYVEHVRQGTQENFLTTLAIFQIRGSYTAKMGHLPEQILRHYMTDWGLQSGIDFNEKDIDVFALLKITLEKNEKVRKFDFIIPFNSRQKGKKLFIQSQFYAGDSGSLSHKVVDQTDSSRKKTLKAYPDALFLEYLDGAGYFSSLNGDLKKMLSKITTKEFFQIRTAPLKLRRELQDIQYITLLEIEHLILEGINKKKDVITRLTKDGYIETEIQFCIQSSISTNILIEQNDIIQINPQRKPLAISYLLLDSIANFGHKTNTQKEKGVYVVPGYGQNWGLNLPDLISSFKEKFPNLADELGFTIIDHIQFLINEGYIQLK